MKLKVVLPLLLLLLVASSILAFLPVKVVYSAKIVRDRYGVPHIYGGTDEDVLFGFGYAQAEDHLEDMILNYYTAMARLSEAVGERGLKSDKIVLTFRIPIIAEEEVKDYPEEILSLLDAFSSGVNLYIEKHRAELPDWIADFKVDREAIVSLSKYVAFSRSLSALKSELEMSDIPISLSLPLNMASIDMSNEMAIGPQRSASGSPILIGDPHLPWTGMNRWYEAHLVSDEGLNMYGATFYGLPLLFIGFNEHVAWTMTRNGPDLADIFMEKVRIDGEISYLTPDGWRKAEVEEYRIKVKGGREESFKVYYTVHGPVIHVDRQNGVAYSAALEGLECNSIIQVYYMDKSKSVGELIESLKLRDILLWNILAVDTSGNLYYIYNAAIHMKSEAYDPHRPRPGWEEDAQWGTLIPFEKLPSIMNPDSGYIQNNNVMPWLTTENSGLDPYDYPVYLGDRNKTLNDRGQRAVELLSSMWNATIEDMIEVATDTLTLEGLRIREEIVNSVSPGMLGEEYVHAYRIVEQWSGYADKDEAAMTIVFLTKKLYEGNITQAFLQAVNLLIETYGEANVPWGQIHVIRRGGYEYPMDGGLSGMTSLWMAGGTIKNLKIVCDRGSSFTFVVEMRPGNITAYTLTPYGVSENPDSPHYADQTKLKSEKRLKKACFYLQDVYGNAESIEEVEVKSSIIGAIELPMVQCLEDVSSSTFSSSIMLSLYVGGVDVH